MFMFIMLSLYVCTQIIYNGEVKHETETVFKSETSLYFLCGKVGDSAALCISRLVVFIVIA